MLLCSPHLPPPVAGASVGAVLFPPPLRLSLYVDMDLAVREGPDQRLLKTFRELWDGLLSWEEILVRKLRRKAVVSSQEPSSSPVLFFSSSASLSTSVA